MLFISISLLKKIKVSESANIGENFKVPIKIPLNKANTIGASPIHLYRIEGLIKKEKHKETEEYKINTISTSVNTDIVSGVQ